MHEQIRSERDGYLNGPRRHLDALAKQVKHDWSRLARCLANADDYRFYQSLHEDWALDDKKQAPTALETWLSSPRYALRLFHESVERFNQAWAAYVGGLDLASLNQLLSDYNAYYPIEKSAAFGSDDIQRLGFIATQPVSCEELRERLLIAGMLRALAATA